MSIKPGTLVATRYRVERPLGKGGMGEVFSAENTRTSRKVAIKVLRAESKAKASAIERFRREARAAGSINSDYVTQVLDVEDDPKHGIVLVFELLEGESLVQRLKRTGPIRFEELWGIVEAVWMGLADAHAAGIIHRDLKPSNVFLQDKQGPGRVKILDFGISKLPKKITTQSLTQVGQSLGTFSFMPPEQIGRAKTVDHRADIYACTTLIYQALSGQLPYQAKNVVAMMEMKNKREPRSLGEAMGQPVDPALEQFISRGLARDPAHRFQTALEALDTWRALRPAGTVSVTELDNSGAQHRYVESSLEPPSGVGEPADSVSTLPKPVRSPLQPHAAADLAAPHRIDPADHQRPSGPELAPNAADSGPGMAGSAPQPAVDNAHGQANVALAATRAATTSPLHGGNVPPAASPSGAGPPPLQPASPAQPAPIPAADPHGGPSPSAPPYSSPPAPDPRPAPDPSGPQAAISGPAVSNGYPSAPGAPWGTMSPSYSEGQQPQRWEPPTGSIADSHQRPKQRSPVLMILGAIALMLLGFGIVALVLHLIK